MAYTLALPTRNEMDYWTVSSDVIHPETCESIILAGSRLSGYVLNNLFFEDGIDTIAVVDEPSFCFIREESIDYDPTYYCELMFLGEFDKYGRLTNDRSFFLCLRGA